MAYIRAIASGNFSSTSTWSGGVVPGAGDTACAGNYRITMDVDTLAVISTVQADLTLAGGTPALTDTGGFVIPAGATRTLPEFRHDFMSSVAKSTLAVAPLAMTHGTLNLTNFTYVNGASCYSAAYHAFCCEPPSPSTCTVNIATLKVLANSPASSQLRHVMLNGASGATHNVTVNNITYVNWTSSTSAGVQAVYTSSSACNFTLTFNCNVYSTGSLSGNAFIEIVFSSATTQNLIFGAGCNYGGVLSTAASYGAMRVSHVNNVTFPSDFSLNESATGLNLYFLTILNLHGQLSLPGTVTLRGIPFLSVVGAGGSIVCGDVNVVTALAMSAHHITTSNIFTALTFGNMYINRTLASYTSSYNVLYIGGASTDTTPITFGAISFAPTNVYSATVVYLVAFNHTVPIVFGTIDGRNSYTTSSNAPVVAVYRYFTGAGSLTVNGNVYGSNLGNAVSDQGVMYLATNNAANTKRLVVNGDVYGGTNSAGISEVVNGTMDIDVNGTITGGAFITGATKIPAGVFSYTRTTRADALVFGPEGRVPVDGYFKFFDQSTASINARDDAGAAFTLSTTPGTVPAATDVRVGVVTGNTVGTLAVPQAANVLAGITFDNGTVGTLNLATDLAAVKAKTDQLAFTGGAVNAHPDDAGSTSTALTAIKAITDQFAFTGAGVVADASGAAADYTGRFNALDTAVGAANTGIAAVKAKTDQLTFTIHGVVADAGATDYTVRFNNLDAAVAQIPTTDYTPRFNAIDADLNAIASGGGVDFTQVLDAISVVDGKVVTGNNTSAAVKAKTDQLTFTANGVVADVSVSVSQVINYDTRFDAIDADLDAVRAKTDQFTFGANGVNATAAVDTAPITAAIGAVSAAIANIDNDLAAHDTHISSQLTLIQNATGAIDLTPVMQGLALVDTHVLNIPTVNYVNRFNAIDANFANVNDDLNTIQAALGTVSVDLTPVLSAVAGVQTTANAIKTKTDTITPCDTTALVGAINDLEARFDTVTAGPITLIPQAPAGSSTLYGYCLNQNGTPRVGETVTVYVQQASGSAALLHSAAQTVTSGPDGLVACTVPRGQSYVYAVKYGNTVERVPGKDAAQVEMPSMIKR